MKRNRASSIGILLYSMAHAAALAALPVQNSGEQAASPPLATLLARAADALAHGDATSGFAALDLAVRTAGNANDERLARSARLDATVRTARAIQGIGDGEEDATRLQQLVSGGSEVETAESVTKAAFAIAAWHHARAEVPGESFATHERAAVDSLEIGLRLTTSPTERAQALEFRSLVRTTLVLFADADADVAAAAAIYADSQDADGTMRCIRRRAYIAYRRGDFASAAALIDLHRTLIPRGRDGEPDLTESRSNAYVASLVHLGAGDLDAAGKALDVLIGCSSEILAHMTLYADVLRTHESSAPQIEILLDALLRYGVAHPENSQRACSLATAIAESAKSRVLRLALRNPLRVDHIARSQERTIPDGIVVARYVVTADEATRERRYALLATRGAASRFVDLGPVETIDDRMREFISVDLSLDGLEHKADSYSVTAHLLFDRLLGPVADWIADSKEPVQRLVVVADGAIGRMPFDALVVTRSNADYSHLDYLVRHLAIVHLPAFGVLDALPRPNTHDRLVAVMASSSDPNSSGLRFLGKEADALRATHRDCTILSGSGATASNLEETTAASPIGWLHLACHAEPDPRARNAARLCLIPGNAIGQGGESLRASEILALSITPGARVVLSACGTASGDFVRGEGVLGIWRAFLATGASCVVSTLRPVDDRSAASWMTSFHESAARGLPLAEAARAADLAWLDGASRSRLPRGSAIVDPAHPALWAAYICIGDDGGLMPCRIAR